MCGELKDNEKSDLVIMLITYWDDGKIKLKKEIWSHVKIFTLFYG